MLELSKNYIEVMKMEKKKTLEFVMSFPSWWKGKRI
jgi:hypothetical protein